MLQDKFKQIESDMNQICLERRNEVHAMLGCIIAHEHGFFLGKPGIGKSHMINTFMKGTSDASKFIKLMTAQTTVNELFGPLDINAFKQGKLTINTDGYIADSHLVMLDEVWKSNSQCLNALLTILEERRFDNGNVTVNAPLVSCFGASNELPEDASLKALYDRFLVRIEVNTLLQQESYRTLYNGLTHQMEKCLSVEDIREANRQSSLVTMSEEVCEAMIDLMMNVKLECGIEVSPRRQVKMVRFLKALAWLDGMAEVDQNYFKHLADCIWEAPTQRQSVSLLLSNYLSAAVKASNKEYDEVIALYHDAMSQTNHAGFMESFKEIMEKMKTLEDKIKRNDEDSPHIERALNTLKDTIKPLQRKYMKMRKL